MRQNSIFVSSIPGVGRRRANLAGAGVECASAHSRLFLWRGIVCALILLLIPALTGCTTGKVLATPLTVVRDTVDAPVVTVTNFFSWVAQSSGGPAAYAGPSWSLRGGFDFGASLNIAGLVFWTLSGVLGGVDYVVCRSFYPNFPWGVSPWRERGASWWSLYYPNTRALWSTPSRESEPGAERRREAPPPEEQPEEPPPSEPRE